jgi:hypothetical protein
MMVMAGDASTVDALLANIIAISLTLHKERLVGCEAEIAN